MKNFNRTLFKCHLHHTFADLIKSVFQVLLIIAAYSVVLSLLEGCTTFQDKPEPATIKEYREIYGSNWDDWPKNVKEEAKIKFEKQYR